MSDRSSDKAERASSTDQWAAAGTSAAAQASAASIEPASRKPKLGPLLSLRPYVLRHRGMLLLALVALVVSALAMLTVPIAVRHMVDQGFAQGPSGRDGGSVDRYFLVLLGIGVLLSIASSSRVYAVNWLGERVVAELRADVFRHLSILGSAFFERTHSGEIMSRLTADTTQLKSAAGSTLSQALRNLIMLIGALAMMIVTSPRLAGLVLLVIPLIVLPLLAFGQVVRRLSRRAQDTLAEASAYAGENLSAHRTMQAFTHEGEVSRRFGLAVDRAFEAARARLAARAGLTAGVILLVFASVVGVLWHGATLVLAGSMSGGTLSQFVLYALFAAGALAELGEVWNEVQQAAGAAERLTELLAVEPDIHSPSTPVPLPMPARGEIEFCDVHFSYPARRLMVALDGVSFKVRPGETVAIVGPSGAGKTTLFALALRFYDPQAGIVRIDGVPVAEADLAEVRRRIALVPQDVALFADTIAENIRYGAPDASREAVEAAARAALADGFIRALPQGYDTGLGERGVTLSGGQRQRIAIARAVLRDAPILLLDEATSALDAESERLIGQALEGIMKNRTTLVIAHRLATVQRAGRILVMDGGRIVEEGTHAQLVAKGGLYSRLARLQLAAAAAE